MTRPDSADDEGRAGSVTVGDLLSVLDQPMRREVLEFFAERSIQRVGFDELVDHLAETRTSAGEPGDRDRIALRLHHVHLPKLADTGVIEYDADTGDLHYQPDGDLEHFLEVTQRIS